jgi:hypothetical protein
MIAVGLLHVLLAERVEQRARARRPTYRSALARCLTGRCVCLLSHELVRYRTSGRVLAHVVLPDGRSLLYPKLCECKITASQFAVDGEVEQREIAAAALKPLRKPSLAQLESRHMC